MRLSHFTSRFRILWSFALRDVSNRRLILVFTIIGLGAAFTAVFLSASILDGFKATLSSGAIDTGGHLTLKAKGGQEHIENIAEVENALTGLANVESFSVRSYGSLTLNNGGKILGAGYAAIGLDPDTEKKTTEIPQRILEGRFLRSNDKKSVVMGVTLADFLSGITYDGKILHAGEKVKYISPTTGNEGEYTLVGILDAKYFHPNWTSYFTKDELERLDSDRKNNEVIIKLKNPEEIENTRREIQRKNLDVEVVTWREKEGYVFNIISAVEFVTGNISNLLIVAVFVITSVIIFINVFQKRRQIGILKSMGASSRFIIAIYMVETLIYSTLAYLLGFVVFMFIYLYSIQHPIGLLIGDFKLQIVESNMLITFASLFLASMLGSFFPARFAARTRIADVIRNMI